MSHEVSPLRFDVIAAEHPEWQGWLGLVRDVRRQMRNPEWEEAARRWVSSDGHASQDSTGPPMPRLFKALMSIERRPLERWVRHVLRVAAANGGPKALGAAASSLKLHGDTLLEGAVGEDEGKLGAVADEVGMPAAALTALAPFISAPLLHACRSVSKLRTPASWNNGCCPVCGAWPTLAEERGLERERRLRCARCGSDWWTDWLRCPYCGNCDHETLGALVAEGSCDGRKVETCQSCRGYLKSVTTLRPIAAEDLFLEDLITADLDLVALDHDYRRPAAPKHPLDVRIVPHDDGRREIRGFRGWLGSRG